MAYRKIVNHIKINEIDSTQDWAKAHYGAFVPNQWTAISADSQSGGRGQFDASWQDVPGSALLTTWVSPEVSWPANTLWARQMSVAKLWAETLRASGYETHIKWPNDLYIGDRKLAGMLTEALWRGHSCYRYFVGIGMNVNQAPEGAISLGPEASVTEWLDRMLVPTAEAIMHPLAETDGYTDLMLGWEQWVRWEMPESGQELVAKPVALDREGRLGVEMKDGGRQWLRPKSWIWKGLV